MAGTSAAVLPWCRITTPGRHDVLACGRVATIGQDSGPNPAARPASPPPSMPELTFRRSHRSVQSCTGGRRRGARARRAGGPVLQPRQGAVRRARRDQARSRRVLPAGGRAAAAHDGRPAGAHAALPPGRGRTVVLPEARSQERARVAGDDDGDDGQRHAVPGAGDRRPRPRRVGGQPRLPRLPRMALPCRRPRPLRRAAPRSRPAAGHRLLARPRRGRGGQGPARRARTSSATPRRPATAGCTCTSVWSRAGTPTRCDPPRWRSPASSSAAGPTSSPRHGGRRSGASASSSTTTRTPRTRPSSAPGRRVPGAAGRCPRRCAGTRYPSSTPMS